MGRYRKKPVVVEAVQWLPDASNAREVEAFLGSATLGLADHFVRGPLFQIETLEGEGTMVAVPGDWVIRGVAGEFYPCKPDIFEVTYEAVE